MPTGLTWSVLLPVIPPAALPGLPTAAVGAVASDPLGVDVKCFPDLDPGLTLEAGTPVVAHALLRRLETPRTGLFYDPNYGFDVRSFMNDSVNLAGFAADLASGIEDECLKDPRVTAADVTVTRLDPTSWRIQVAVTLSSATRFDLIANVSQVDVSGLNAEVAG